MSENQTAARLDAVVAAISSVCSDGNSDARRVAQDALAAADAVDPLRVPSAHLAGKVPLVLYFANRADADEFVQVVKDAFVNPVEIAL